MDASKKKQEQESKRAAAAKKGGGAVPQPGGPKKFGLPGMVPKGGSGKGGPGQDAVVDEMFNALKAGNIFRNRRQEGNNNNNTTTTTPTGGGDTTPK